MNDPLTIIVIDDDNAVLKSLQQTLELEEYQVRGFNSAKQALSSITANQNLVVITDINMPEMDGLAFLKLALNLDPGLPVIMLTGHGNIETAVAAMRTGAYDFLEKPFSTEHLLDIVKRAAEKRSLILENQALKVELEAQSGPGPRILGNSPQIKQLRRVLSHIKDAPADVLLQGETGTGKDLVARFLHDHSKRAAHPFVAINCGAVPETMIESELFGHEAGAFTGALKRRIGKLAYAHKGTLFLDEIESMPITLQIKLLRVLEERIVEPLGTNKAINLDIRVIAATKADLQSLSAQGLFRSDLYYRLNVVSVQIPPLRDRTEDLPLLLENFVRVASSRYQIDPPAIPLSRHQALKQHNWPGNVRELRNLAERFVLMGDQAELLAPGMNNGQVEDLSLIEQVARFERTLLSDALRQHQGRLKDVQYSLGLARKTLYEKMKKYNLEKDDYKE